MVLPLQQRVELAPLTTLDLGGLARWAVDATDEAMVGEALGWARQQDLAVTVLGGGSNVVVADRGVDGLVVRVALRGVNVERDGDLVLVTAAAGEPWDELVERCVAEGWAGVECLAGIPGTAGATPIQNVGAYGQEVAETIERVRVLDRSSLRVRELLPAELGFGYRSSVLRSQPDRYVVLAVRFRLQRGSVAAVRYPELANALAARGPAPRLTDVRAAVLELRQRKSMVLRPDDPNRRSVGSFFVNPVLSDRQLEALEVRLQTAGVTDPMPTFDSGGGGSKVPAAWLVERAGFRRGHVEGRVGLSSGHSLAVINRGGAAAAELIAFARRIQHAVLELSGIRLRPEPVFLGFSSDDPLGGSD